MFPDELNPTKVDNSQSISKKMIASSFSLTEHITTFPLEDRKTVNAKEYAEILLANVIKKIIVQKEKKNAASFFITATPTPQST